MTEDPDECYYRLVKETDHYIQLSPKGIDIPGAECVKLQPIPHDHIFDSWCCIITFEDGRNYKVKIPTITFVKPKGQYIFEK